MIGCLERPFDRHQIFFCEAFKGRLRPKDIDTKEGETKGVVNFVAIFDKKRRKRFGLKIIFEGLDADMLFKKRVL